MFFMKHFYHIFHYYLSCISVFFNMSNIVFNFSLVFGLLILLVETSSLSLSFFCTLTFVFLKLRMLRFIGGLWLIFPIMFCFWVKLITKSLLWCLDFVLDDYFLNLFIVLYLLLLTS